MSTLKVNAIRHSSASSDAITFASDGTATAKITNNLSNRNLIINGDMRIAQRGTTSTANNYGTIDNFGINYGGTDEAPTQAQVDIAAGTTPYTLGFRKAFQITNGNQTSGAGAGDWVGMYQWVESQDCASSGWNYTSTSSYITLSFWVKSSVAQNFYGYCRTNDGTNKLYPFETGSLSAGTWTKVTKKIPGHADIQFDNNNGHGIGFEFWAFIGTDYTDSGATTGVWSTYTSGSRTLDAPTTWYTTNDATLEITGVQLEAGDTATDFEFRTYGDELARCKRYFHRIETSANGNPAGIYMSGLLAYNTTSVYGHVCDFPTTMRAIPTVTKVGTITCGNAAGGNGGAITSSNFDYCTRNQCCTSGETGSSGLVGGNCSSLNLAADTSLSFSAGL